MRNERAREARETVLETAWSSVRDIASLERAEPSAELLAVARAGVSAGSPLESRLPVARLAHGAVAFAESAARRLGAAPSALESARIATAYSSERHVRVGGERPEVWAELSGFWPTADGWLRTHGNYRHHAERLALALGVDPAEAAVRERLSDLTATQAERLIVDAGGVAAAVRSVDEWTAHPHGALVPAQPLIAGRPREAGSRGGVRERVPDASTGPLTGVRVLDLTRVLAGPVATRTLAHWGARVLRVDPPHPREHEWVHLDTGAGKRSALLDVRRNPDAFRQLLDGADVVVHGYRPGVLDRLGLGELLAERPRIVVASVSAWGEGPWHARRGFDSIVQAASGIALALSPGEGRPGALPVQALDHSAGYLLAGAIGHAIAAMEAGAPAAELRVSLARVALELTPPQAGSAEPTGSAGSTATGSAAGKADEVAFEPTLQRMQTDVGELVTAAPALGDDRFASPPRPWGADPPRW